MKKRKKKIIKFISRFTLLHLHESWFIPSILILSSSSSSSLLHLHPFHFHPTLRKRSPGEVSFYLSLLSHLFPYFSPFDFFGSWKKTRREEKGRREKEERREKRERRKKISRVQLNQYHALINFLITPAAESASASFHSFLLFFFLS